MDKVAYFDIGELGWTLYLSAHINWLQKDTAVFTNRPAFFDRSEVLNIPQEFFDKYGDKPADCLWLYGVPRKELAKLFQKYTSYKVKDYSEFKNWRDFKGKTKYISYLARGLKWVDIAVFPRFRKEEGFNHRNLPKEFYQDLVFTLCKEYSDLKIGCAGSKEGAYDITVPFKNYVNLVGKTDLQELIDICTTSKVTIGGQSAPPKLALLQKTPSYFIGHEKERVTKEENWKNTKAGFWEIEKYNTFVGNEMCRKDILKFVDECINNNNNS